MASSNDAKNIGCLESSSSSRVQVGPAAACHGLPELRKLPARATHKLEAPPSSYFHQSNCNINHFETKKKTCPSVSLTLLPSRTWNEALALICDWKPRYLRVLITLLFSGTVENQQLKQTLCSPLFQLYFGRKNNTLRIFVKDGFRSHLKWRVRQIHANS